MAASTRHLRRESEAARETDQPHEPTRVSGPPSNALLPVVRRSVHTLNNLLTAMVCQCDLLRAQGSPAPGEASLAGFQSLLEQARQEVQRLSVSCAREAPATDRRR